MFKGIERSNSAILDPHKSLFLPWGSGMLLVRDVMPLAKAHGYSGNYMQDAIAAAGEMSPSETSPELTKPFRALRMWLPLILLGVKPFRAALEEKLLLARYFYEEVQTLGFEVGPMPDLSIVTFRWAPAGASLEQTNEWNRAIVDGARKDGRIFISSTTLDDRFTIRMAVLGFRTHKRTIDLALRVLREQVAALT
jgi:aromatic-L-amino-acid/L-tryptophan decarboxylase